MRVSSGFFVLIEDNRDRRNGAAPCVARYDRPGFMKMRGRCRPDHNFINKYVPRIWLRIWAMVESISLCSIYSPYAEPRWNPEFSEFLSCTVRRYSKTFESVSRFPHEYIRGRQSRRINRSYAGKIRSYLKKVYISPIESAVRQRISIRKFMKLWQPTIEKARKIIPSQQVHRVRRISFHLSSYIALRYSVVRSIIQRRSHPFSPRYRSSQ